MRIGILTQPLSHNYGGIIQNYALQIVLRNAGFTVETINHHIKSNGGIKVKIFNFVRFIKKFFNKNLQYKYFPTENETKVIEYNLQNFINKYINLTRNITNKKGFLIIDSERQYDAYIVGSDQCWRPRYNKGFLDSMFLSFVKREVKRIAYAVSFGADNWEYSASQTNVCSRLIKQFQLVTVREDSGIELCKQYFKIDSIQVLDPTMLLHKKDYIELIEKEGEQMSEGSLFNYILDPTSKKSAFINRIEVETGLKSFQILPKYHSTDRTKEVVKNHIEDCIYPSMTKWLRAFWDAKMVVVDSFHGMVFSIIFNKPFWVIGNKSRGLSRFTSLLNMLHLENRLIDESKFSIVDVQRPINWNEVNSIINKKNIESIQLLINSLK